MPQVTTALEAGLGNIQAAPLRAPPTPANADASSFGAGPVLHAIEGLGHASANIAGDMLQGTALERRKAEYEARQKQEFNDRIFAHKASLDATLGAQEWMRTMQEGAAPGAPGFTDAVKAKFEEVKKTALDGAPSEVARQMLEERLGTLQLSVIGDAAQFEDHARTAHAKTQLEGSQDSAMALAYTHPERAGDALRQQLEMVNAAPGMNADAKAEVGHHITNAINGAMWKGLAEKDPANVLHAMRTQDNLGIDLPTRLGIASSAQSEVNRREAEGRAAQAARMADLSDKTRFALSVIDQGLVPAGLDNLRRQTAGTPLAAVLEQAQGSVAYAHAYALKPPEQKMAEYEAMRAAPQTEGSMIRLGAATKVLQADQQAVQSGTVLERAGALGVAKVDQLDPTDAASMQGRLDAARAAGSHFGVDAGFLTKGERAAFLTQFQQAAPQQKVELLAGMQAANPDAYQLMLKDLGGTGGLDRATRYLSLLSGRPEAAPVQNAIVEAASSKPEDLKVAVEAAGMKQSDLHRQVVGELADFMRTVGQTYGQGSGTLGGGAGAMVTDLTDMAEKAASVLMRDHSANDAVKLAVGALVNDRYIFRDSYRLPKALEPELPRFDQMLSDTMAAITPESLAVPGSVAGQPKTEQEAAMRRQVYMEQVQGASRWVTMPDESGLLLTDPTGNAVVAFGKPVIVKFGGVSPMAGFGTGPSLPPVAPTLAGKPVVAAPRMPSQRALRAPVAPIAP